MPAGASASRSLESCFRAHRRLAARAGALAVRLRACTRTGADELRIGASCVLLAIQGALSRDATKCLRAWTDCQRAERQIRAATARALIARRIDNEEYDSTFQAARECARLRGEQMNALRNRLKRSLHT
jgi:hypothetical protein